MAGTLAQLPVLQVAAQVVENVELGGCSRKARRTNRVNVRASAAVAGSSPSAGHSLQTLTGFRRAGTVDALTLRSGRDFQSTVFTPVVGRASSGGVDVVAEIEEKATELIISPIVAQEEEEESSSNGGHKTPAPAPSTPKVETGESLTSGRKISSSNVDDARSRTFNSGSDFYRPPGAGGRSSESATSSSFRPGSIPSSILSKKGGKTVYVERWMPPGSKLHQVKQILERLELAEPTDEGVAAVMEGWDTSINPRDITSAMSNLKWKTAQAFFNWLKSQGYELNVVVYNVLLGRFRAGRAWRVAEDFADRMVSDGIQLDNYTYSTLISCALQCNQPQDALKWFDKMHEADCVPDEVVYSNMALVYSRLGRFSDAVELYERLRETGWKPDKVSFGTMVNVYSRGGNYFKASAVIREMQQAGLQPEAVVYNTLIKYFTREAKTGQAKRVFQDMERAGVKPTEYTLSLMVDVHGRAGEIQEAFQLFNRMKEEKLPLDVVVYNSLLKMCAEERLIGEAENLLAGMVGRGLTPDIVTYKSIINLYAKEGRIKDAEKFADRMVEVGFKLDVVVYSCLIKACGNSKDFKTAAAFLDQMLADGCLVDDKCCGVLLSLMNHCDTDEDRAIIIGCLRKSKPLLSEIADALLAEELDLDALQELVRRLLSESEPGSHRPFCNAFVDLCWNLDKKDRAQQVLSLADTFDVYHGGLRAETKRFWILHLRSLSFSAAECGLHAWIRYLREKLELGEEFPEMLVIETGAGREKGDVARLFNVMLSKLKDMGAPFEPSLERLDWISSAGSDVMEWLAASAGPELPTPSSAEE